MRTPKSVMFIIVLTAFSFPILSQQDTLVPESIKAPIEFPDPEDLDKIPLSMINEKEFQFVQDMYGVNLFKIRLVQQAKTKATREEVKEFAKGMAEDHIAMNEGLYALAGKKRITLPDTLPVDQMDRLNQMIKKSGREYENAFIALMIRKNQESLAISERAAKSCKDNDISQWFESALPILRHDLDKVKDLKEKITGRSEMFLE